MIAGLRSRVSRGLDRRSRRTVDRVLQERLTYLEPDALLDLARLVRAIERRKLPGVLIEAGCALGGSAIVIAQAKRPSRPFDVYDVFGLIPEPSDRDGPDVLERYETIAAGHARGIRGDTYYGYREDLRRDVEDAFRRFDLPVSANAVRLVKGRFEDTMHPQEAVALAHLDCDWHDSVLVCLERIAPMMVPGGTFVIDDYDAWSGARTAVDAYLSVHGDEFDVRRGARLHLVKHG
jgi:asparagine synthase (glutamine-hydrolysing)